MDHEKPRPLAGSVDTIDAPLLDVRDLNVSFQLERIPVYAVQGLSLHVECRRATRRRR